MMEDFLLYSITMFTFAVIFGFCYIRHTFTFFERHKLPRGATPVFPLGNVSDVVFQRVTLFMHLWKYYNKFKRKKYKIGGFYVFLKPAVVVTDSRLINDIIKNNEHFTNRDVQQKDIEFNQKLLDAIFKMHLKIWSDIIPDIKCENEVNFNRISETYLKSILNETNCSNERIMQSVIQDFRKKSLFHSLKQVLSISYPYLCSREANLQDYVEYFELIVQHRKKNDIKEDDLIQHVQDMNLSENDSARVLHDFLINLRRSISLLSLCLFEICINQDIQDDLRGEILRFTKQNGNTIKFDDINKLSYLETVVRETLRKYPARPLLCLMCHKTYTNGDITIPENVLVFISVFGIHHNIANYFNPELFDPDRFSEENEKFIDSHNYLPFGDKVDTFELQYIKTVIKLSLFKILSRFKLLPSKRSMKTLNFEETLTELMPKGKMWFKFEELSEEEAHN